MREILAEIDIDASPEHVWRVLTDFSSFAAWNPLIQAVAGEPHKGARLRVSVRLPPGVKLSFKATVTNCEPNRELSWGERFVRPGLFSAHHSFIISPLDGGGARFAQVERLVGPLALFPACLGVVTSMHTGLDQMNQALKVRAENLAMSPR